MLIDNHGRPINYLRLAVTDRCNLRCFYRMPENGIRYVSRKDLLTFEEMERLIGVMGEMGLSKVRITGGEPFVRTGMMEFLERVARIKDISEIHITTNGTFTLDKVAQLKKIGIQSVNLSLDSLDRERFFQITRRDLFHQVFETYQALLKSGISLKVNMVVMEGRNIEDIYPILELARNAPVSVRFIEEMPFNGTPGMGNPTFWPMQKILEHIGERYQFDKQPDPPFSTSYNYQIQGFNGTFGVIAAYTRTFCGTCNRLRVTPQGELRTCLYADGGLNLRDLMRSETNDQMLASAIVHAVQNRAKDGFEAEQLREKLHPVSESMATIGG